MNLKAIFTQKATARFHRIIWMGFFFILCVFPIAPGHAGMPEISGLLDSYIQENGEALDVVVTVSDTPGDEVDITVNSSNTDVVPENETYIKINNEGSPCTKIIPVDTGELNFHLIIEHAQMKCGVTDITLTVADGSDVAQKTFSLDFPCYCDFSRPYNDYLTDTTAIINTPKEIKFQISGRCVELLLSMSSGNTDLIPNDLNHILVKDRYSGEEYGFENIHLGFSDMKTEYFFLVLTPAADRSGTSIITTEIKYRFSPLDPWEVEYWTFEIKVGLSAAEGGDVDGDGVLMMPDIILALKVVAGITDTTAYAAADVDGDLKVGLAEAVFVMQKYAGVR